MAGMKVVPVGTAHDGSVNMEDLFKKVKIWENYFNSDFTFFFTFDSNLAIFKDIVVIKRYIVMPHFFRLKCIRQSWPV